MKESTSSTLNSTAMPLEPKSLLSEKPLSPVKTTPRTPMDRTSPPSEISTQTAHEESDLPSINLSVPRKCVVLFLPSWMVITAFLPNTALFIAIPEISHTFSIQESLVTTTNSLMFISMALSTFIWGPLILVIGRRKAFNLGIVVLIGTSIICALAPNFGTLVGMRFLGALQVTMFNILGQEFIADVFLPEQRGRAIGVFQAVTVISPSLGPLVGGVIITFTNWRVIFWLESAMAGAGLLMSLLFMPDIPACKSSECLTDKPAGTAVGGIWKLFNPLPTLRVLFYPNVFLIDLACGLLAYTLYSLLTMPRHLPLFHTTSTSLITPSLFYIAPGLGSLLGAIIGGYLSDLTVKSRITVRGFRLPQDRLKSGSTSCGFFIILPISFMIFSWCLQENIGGLPVAIISSAGTGLGFMIAFSGCNTYVSEVLPQRRSEVLGGKYLLQYLFGAAGSATVVPLIEGVGIGITGTIGASLAVIAGVLVALVAWRGLDMQVWWTKGKT